MGTKNYAEVLIDGKIYTLGGPEEQEYLQRVAAFISDKIAALRAQPGFTRQSVDYQNVMIQLNLADDYFKILEEAERLRGQNASLEREIYSLKHELISTQMKLEAVLEKDAKTNEG